MRTEQLMTHDGAASRHQEDLHQRDLHEWLAGHRWLLTTSNIVASLLFVIGCIGFYSPQWYTASVTLFLLGSLIFLAAAIGTAALDHRR